jgi:hypothetical protein
VVAVADEVFAVDDRGVVARAAGNVIACAVDGDEAVIAGAAEECVGVDAAGEGVVAGAAVEQVAPPAAL